MGLSLSPVPFLVYKMELISYLPVEEKYHMTFGGL